MPAMIGIRVDDTFAAELPRDPVEGSHTRRVRDALYSYAPPTPVRAPKLLAFSESVARGLGLDCAALLAERDGDPGELTRILAGNTPFEGAVPLATRYGGHQFGNWAGQLGDGRAIRIAEVMTASGGRQELQLKGAGPTPYSRRADGRAVLRSSLREFVCSEAMHALGVPTTRALSLVSTGEEVERDMFYDGHPDLEPGAIVCRVAPTFLRFGHFEILAAEDEDALLARLFAYTVRTHFPDLSPDPDDPDAVIAFFDEVARRTAFTVAEWQRVGFVHGVMNTDNMSILGLTIDYGPYGFVEPYDPGFTPNTTDAHGRRYRYGAQPNIALWNLARLAEALSPLLAGKLARDAMKKRLVDAVDMAGNALGDALRAMYGRKLGFDAGEDDDPLIGDVIGLLARTELDHTLFFRSLTRGAADGRAPSVAELEPLAYGPLPRHADALIDGLARLVARWGRDPRTNEARAAAMAGANPVYVPRNWLAQEAIDAAAAGDLAPLARLREVLERPYDERTAFARYADKRPDWARTKPGCAMLSCSS